MTTRTTTRPGLTTPATPNLVDNINEVTTTTRPTTRAGATLGYAADRPTKSLIAAGLDSQGFEAQFIIEGQDGPFRVVSAQVEPDQDVLAARAFISGLLFCLCPPDPLADVVRVYKSEWARFSGLKGKSVPGWSFGCAAPGCIVVAGVRVAHQALAVEQIVTLGWRLDDNAGWLCPHHAGTVTP